MERRDFSNLHNASSRIPGEPNEFQPPCIFPEMIVKRDETTHEETRLVSCKGEKILARRRSRVPRKDKHQPPDCDDCIRQAPYNFHHNCSRKKTASKITTEVSSVACDTCARISSTLQISHQAVGSESLNRFIPKNIYCGTNHFSEVKVLPRMEVPVYLTNLLYSIYLFIKTYASKSISYIVSSLYQICCSALDIANVLSLERLSAHQNFGPQSLHNQTKTTADKTTTFSRINSARKNPAIRVSFNIVYIILFIFLQCATHIILVRASEFPDRECCDSAPPPPPFYHTTSSTTPVPPGGIHVNQNLNQNRNRQYNQYHLGGTTLSPVPAVGSGGIYTGGSGGYYGGEYDGYGAVGAPGGNQATGKSGMNYGGIVIGGGDIGVSASGTYGGIGGYGRNKFGAGGNVYTGVGVIDTAGNNGGKGFKVPPASLDPVGGK